MADASSGDAAVDTPALTDAGADGDAAVPAFVCPPGALLCDDFERPSLLGPFSKAYGAPSISSAQAHSPSRSLSAVLSMNQASPQLEATLSGVSKMSLSFWFLVESPPPPDGYNVRIAHLLSGPACDWDSTWQLSLTRNGLYTYVGTYDADANASCGPVEFDGEVVHPPAATFDAKWHHVFVDLDVSSQTRRATVRVDDLAPVVHAMPSKRTGPVTSTLLGIGVPCVQKNAGCFDWDQPTDYGVFIDDVTVTPVP